MTATATPIASVIQRGVLSFMISLPTVVAGGLVAFAPLGASVVPAGVAAALISACVGSLVFPSIAGCRLVFAGPSPAVSVLTAGVMASLLQHHAIASGDAVGAVALLMLLCGLAGVFQVLLGIFQIGRLVQLLPYPVIAGLVNTTAVLLVISQLPHALGITAGGGLHVGAIIVSGLTLAIALAPVPGPLPAPVIAAVAGTVAHYALAAWWPAAPLGPTLGATDTIVQHIGGLSRATAEVATFSLDVWASVILPGALSLALLASLETLVVVASLRDRGVPRSSSRQDILALGTSNILCGLLGAMPCSGNTSTTLAMWHSGNRSHVTALVRSALILALLGTPLPILSVMPKAMLAGLVLAMACRLVDADILSLAWRSLQRGFGHRGEMIGNAAIVVLVMAVGVGLGLVAAVAVGVALALIVFASTMGRGILRRSYRNPIGRSRTRHGTAATAALLQHGDQIDVLEIEGAVFFGSIDRLAQAVETALAGGARSVVLDMRRVGRIDLSGARRLVQMCERFWQAGHWLVVAPVRPGSAVHDYLADLGLLARMPSHGIADSLEAALARAEMDLLETLGLHDMTEAITAETALGLLGLPSHAAAELLAVADVVTVPEGAHLVSAGDPADSVFILLSGTLDVLRSERAAGGQRLLQTRLATLGPGTLVGELSLISTAPRSADVVAPRGATCLCIGQSALAVLRERDPEAAYAFLAAITRQIELKLRQSDATIMALEE